MVWIQAQDNQYFCFTNDYIFHVHHSEYNNKSIFGETLYYYLPGVSFTHKSFKSGKDELVTRLIQACPTKNLDALFST